MSRVVQAFQLELPVKALFDSPTIAEIAKIITLNQAKPASQPDLEWMLDEIEAMSEVEVEQRLARAGLPNGGERRHE